jgi:hypothetical protein
MGESRNHLLAAHKNHLESMRSAQFAHSIRARQTSQHEVSSSLRGLRSIQRRHFRQEGDRFLSFSSQRRLSSKQCTSD